MDKMIRTLRCVNIDYRDFKIFYDGQFLARIDSEKWYSWTADITLDDGRSFQLKKAFWFRSWAIMEGDKELINIEFNNNRIIFSKNEEFSYLFYPRKRSFFKSDCAVLTNYKNEDLLCVCSDFNWKEFETFLTIECEENFGNNDFEKILILLCVRYFKVLTESD